MVRKHKSKLFKLVCKHSELMRAPFRHCSWKNSMKKRFAIAGNEIGKKFRLKVAQLSVGKSWSDIRKEWIIIKQIHVSKRSRQCLCGRGNLKFVTYLKNRRNKQEITSGNCCLLTFQR